MIIEDIISKANLKVITGDTSKKFEGVYIGDLLSRCMSHVSEGNLWITIMNNINVIAVASLTDCAAIILVEDVQMSEDVVNTAKEKNITILSTNKSAYELCCIINCLSE